VTIDGPGGSTSGRPVADGAGGRAQTTVFAEAPDGTTQEIQPARTSRLPQRRRQLRRTAWSWDLVSPHIGHRHRKRRPAVWLDRIREHNVPPQTWSRRSAWAAAAPGCAASSDTFEQSGNARMVIETRAACGEY